MCPAPGYSCVPALGSEKGIESTFQRVFTEAVVTRIRYCRLRRAIVPELAFRRIVTLDAISAGAPPDECARFESAASLVGWLLSDIPPQQRVSDFAVRQTGAILDQLNDTVGKS